jgi:hypothetical protein
MAIWELLGDELATCDPRGCSGALGGHGRVTGGTGRYNSNYGAHRVEGTKEALVVHPIRGLGRMVELPRCTAELGLNGKAE